jgi:hypothetical protein
VSYYKIYRNGTSYATVSSKAQFAGYISGTTLTVTSVTSGKVLPNLPYSATGLAAGTVVVGPWAPVNGGTGNYDVSIPQTLGSSGSPVTFTGWQYTDTAAPHSFYTDLSHPSVIYAYTVSAVDAQGNEGPKAYPAAYMFYGQSFVGQGDLSYGALACGTPGSPSCPVYYEDTAGSPANGPYDVRITYPGDGGWLPTVLPSLGPINDVEVGAFNYFTVDIKITASQSVKNPLICVIQSRLPPGDAGNFKLLSLWNYGTPIVNQWVTFKVPLADFLMGTGTFTGSISGTTLTTTSINSGIGVDGSGFVFGTGVPDGSYTINHGQAGSTGTFTLAGPNVPAITSSRTMNFQRTSDYKIGFYWQNTPTYPVTMYVNNMGFTVQ